MATVKIKGMRCGHCSSAVTKALEEIEGISNVDVDLENGLANYSEKDTVPLETIKEAITKIGFEVVE